MKVNIILIGLVLFGIYTASLLAQVTIINGRNFEKRDDKWFQKENGKSYEVDCKVITVKYKSSILAKSINLFQNQKKVTVIRRNALGFSDLEIPDNSDPISIVQDFINSGLVELAEPNTIGEYHAIPNDPYFSSQWALNNTATEGADINAAKVWNIETGNSSVIIGILDSGTDWLHEDLGQGTGSNNYSNIWENLGEDIWSFVPTNPNDPCIGDGIDNDGNGYIDDRKGWDFDTSQDNNNSRGSFFHGTHVAGIVSAKTNNNVGISGVVGGWGATGSKLMILGVGNSYPIGSVLDDAILYAASNGARIITLSLGVGQTYAIDAALQTAYETYGCFINCSSGNEDSPVEYPASNQYVVAVGATGSGDARIWWSNYGPELSVVAPGLNIYSTMLDNSYGYESGTSMAAPHVAGIAGLILSVNSNLTPSEVRDIIQQTADDKGEPGRDDYYGYGRVNAYQAVLLALAHANKSVSSQATTFNGQRKLYKSGSTLHEVFSSGTIDGGEIFYRRSTDNGVSWDITKRLSDGTATSLAPCISMASEESTVLVVWQQSNGSNYNVMFSRSTNGGSTWSSISSLQSNFSCESPGPLPSVAGNNNSGSVLIVYRTSSGLKYVYSGNSMSSWSSPYSVPGTDGNYNSPATAFNIIDNPGIDKCNLAYSTDDTYSSQVYYNYFDFNPYAWSTATNLSDILTGYAYHQKPSLAVSWDPNIVHVAWEASVAPHPTPVVVHRKGYSGNFGSQYYVISANTPGNPSITGLSSDNAWMVFQNSESGGFYKIKHYNSGGSWIWGTPTFVSSDPYCNAQLSVGSGNPKYIWTSGSSTPFTINISTETLSKPGSAAFNYSRELNLIDSKTGASISLEIQQPQIILGDGTTSLIPFTNVPSDSIIITPKEIFSYGNIQSFIPSADIDTVKLQYSVRMIRGQNLLSKTAGTISFDIYDVQSGNPVIRISSQDIIADSDTTNHQYQINLPYKSISSLINTKEIMVRPVIAGLIEESQEMTAGLGHIYRYDTKVESGSPKDLIAETAMPVEYHLGQNYPNPFNPSTVIRYQVPEDGLVSLRIYDVLGREIKELVNEFKAAGRYEVTFDASGLASGMYLYRLRADKYTSVKKMVLLR